jgi:hypothetical protein
MQIIELLLVSLKPLPAIARLLLGVERGANNNSAYRGKARRSAPESHGIFGPIDVPARLELNNTSYGGVCSSPEEDKPS